MAMIVLVQCERCTRQQQVRQAGGFLTGGLVLPDGWAVIDGDLFCPPCVRAARREEAELLAPLGSFRGPCDACGHRDARHRDADTIVERVRAGEPVADVADDMGTTVLAVERLTAEWEPRQGEADGRACICGHACGVHRLGGAADGECRTCACPEYTAVSGR